MMGCPHLLTTLYISRASRALGTTAFALAWLIGSAQAGPSYPATVHVGVPDNSTLAVSAQEVLRRAYAKLGVAFKPQVLPLRRGLQMAQRGELDGDLMRAASVLDQSPQLLKINVPVAEVSYNAYKRGICPESISTALLAQSKVAYFRGVRLIEALLPASALIESNNTWDALRRLEFGQAEYVLDASLEADVSLIAHGSSGICKIAKPVYSAPLFHALNERHAALAEALAQVLRAMSDSGEIAAIHASDEKRHLETARAAAR